MDAPQYKSIEYQFRDQRLYEDYYALFSIGWEYWASPEVYYRDCRTSAYKQCVFQYTVSGEGTLVYNQKAYAIKPGQAFLIERPGQYQYYRSPNAKLAIAPKARCSVPQPPAPHDTLAFLRGHTAAHRGEHGGSPVCAASRRCTRCRSAAASARYS